ncbi:hypothetical protein D3C75_359550 [compost metagenome]
MNVTTGEVRLSYVTLFSPRANQAGQEPKYSVTLLIPKHDIATMQRIQAAFAAAVQEGISKGYWQPGAQPKTVLYDGDGLRPQGEPFGPECRGHWVIRASSKQKPGVFDENLNPILDQTKVYSGVYGRVNFRIYAYSNQSKGIGAQLEMVQVTRPGEPLGGRITVEEAFGGAPAGAGFPSQGWGQQPPAYPQQPAPTQYGQQPPTAYPQQPAPPQYGQAPQQPNYGQQPPAFPQQGYGQPPQQPPAPQPPQQQIDPITGKPLGGGVWGI